MVKQKYLDKAEILIEALPYIQRFSGKIIVIKYGGSAMLDDELKMKVIKDAVLLKLVGFKPVIVHGGGKEINRWVDKVGMEHEFIDGFRVTDGDTMELVEMVLSKVNKDLVAKVQSLGVNAAGISGKDGGLIKVKKKMPEGKDIGFVGDIVSVDTKLVEDLIEKDFLPVIFPLGMDDEFNTYNVNADEAAAAIATGLHISGGMLPKIQNCIDALKGGITRIHIMDGRIPHSLLLEIFTNKGIGTAILSDEEEKYWDGKH